MVYVAPHLISLQQGGCVACHDGSGLGLGAPGDVRLDSLRARHTPASLAGRLDGHYGLDSARAASVAGWLWSEGEDVELRTAEVGGGAIARGQALWDTLGCRACHLPEGIDGIATRTDHVNLEVRLRQLADPAAGMLHDFALSTAESHALAAWLLRDQLEGDVQQAVEPGLLVECFEFDVQDGSLPELAGLEPVRRGRVEVVDVSPRTRDDRFALRFSGFLSVPTDGEYEFRIGSDDGGWLWVDEELVVENEGIHPFRHRAGKVTLSAGAHAVRIVFVEKDGGERLEWQWRGPGFDLQVVPGSALMSSVVKLVPPTRDVQMPTDVEAAQRNFAQMRCAACHETGTDAAPAAALDALTGSRCAVIGDVAVELAAVDALRASPPRHADLLAAAMHADGCLSCHRRGEDGGLGQAALATLREAEDLGEEGRIPPDLTDVGRRLRREWTTKVLSGEERPRGYLAVRMPHLPAGRAERYAEWFEQVDFADAVDEEPRFDANAVADGQRLVGSKGHNCITCHPFGGRPSLGAQGMDLAIQYERLRPGWFQQWLLHPTKLRPGTRMPAFWFEDNETARADAAAIRLWASLGDSAPVPDGFPKPGGMVLDPVDVPVLHGAFLQGLSARCVAVGTPERAHYAYDVEHGRLAWMWRGGFVDASGTWSGRAGKLLAPLGEDAVVFDAAGSGGLRFVAKEPIRVVGRRMEVDGYPVWRLRVDGAVVEDGIRPRLARGGAEFVRVIRCVHGQLSCSRAPEQEGLQLIVAAEGSGPWTLAAGESMEVVYRW